MTKSNNTETEIVKYRLKPSVRRVLIAFMVLLLGYLSVSFIINNNSGLNFFDKGRDDNEEMTAKEDNQNKDDDEKKEVSSISTSIMTQYPANTKVGMSKAAFTNQSIDNTCMWQATDYVLGDIGIGKYQVQRGDTLWELADGSYGQPLKWKKIMKRNAKKVGILPSGQKALIFPKQVLVIPE